MWLQYCGQGGSENGVGKVEVLVAIVHRPVDQGRWSQCFRKLLRMCGMVGHGVKVFFYF